MKTGTVIFYNEKQGYGFIKIDGSEDQLFVHKSGLIDHIENSEKVSFEEVQGERGLKAVNVKIIIKDKDNDVTKNDSKYKMLEEYSNGKNSNEIIKSISENWKLEAKLESKKNYFYHFNEVGSILDRSKYYIIGRKGSGKSSISEYILNLSSFDTFSEKLSFKNFPFNELYSLDNQKYTPPNQYITLWKYLIYSTVAKLMVRNEKIDINIRKELSDIYAPSPIRSLSRTINNWTSAEFGATFFGTGVDLNTLES